MIFPNDNFKLNCFSRLIQILKDSRALRTQKPVLCGHAPYSSLIDPQALLLKDFKAFPRDDLI